jgi:D-amino peptidase
MNAGDGGPVGIDSSFDAMVLHGLHSMAGAPYGILSHSFYPFPKNIWFDNQKIGEIAMNIYLFGEYNVPCVLVTGDQAAVDEAREIVPEITGAVVKWGLEEKEKLGALSIRKAISLSPVKARKLVKTAAKNAMKNMSKVQPLKLKAPFTLKVEYINSKYLEGPSQNVGVKRINENTIVKVCKCLEDVFF